MLSKACLSVCSLARCTKGRVQVDPPPHLPSSLPKRRAVQTLEAIGCPPSRVWSASRKQRPAALAVSVQHLDKELACPHPHNTSWLCPVTPSTCSLTTACVLFTGGTAQTKQGRFCYAPTPAGRRVRMTMSSAPRPLLLDSFLVACSLTSQTPHCPPPRAQAFKPCPAHATGVPTSLLHAPAPASSSAHTCPKRPFFPQSRPSLLALLLLPHYCSHPSLQTRCKDAVFSCSLFTF